VHKSCDNCGWREECGPGHKLCSVWKSKEALKPQPKPKEERETTCADDYLDWMMDTFYGG
jgi:hypothetical protein